MDDRAVRRPNLELVKTDDLRSNSGVQSAMPAAGEGVPPIDIVTGAILDGKYLIGRVIGSGAVGIVFEAKNVELDETVAIKCLRPEMLVDKAMVGRFAREAKAAAAIKSEYVATVHDVGTSDGGVPYIVMEYLDGKDLGTYVAETGTIGPRTAVEYMLQVCEALAVAHSKGIVHRDIKPENLLLTERAGGMRIVKVLDFGISKTALTGSIFQNELPIVKTVNLMGTPLYMSPEQVRVSSSVDVRSDIWSLGMVTYEILTGQTAFAGQSITEICAAILEHTPTPIEVHRNDLPSGLVEVVTKCLQKDVSKRYQNIAELALALMPFGPKRTRLNVERAVAVLQGSGQLDPSVRVHSTAPPGTHEIQHTPIPRPPSVPNVNVTGGSDSVPGSAPQRVAPGPEIVASAGDPPFRKKTPTGTIVAVLALLLGVGGIAAVATRGPSSKKIAPAETSQAPTAVAATVAPPPSQPLRPASENTAEPAEASTTKAGAGASAPAPTAKPAWATAPRPASVAPGKAPSTTPKPKTSAKTGEEPDLGY